MHALTNGCVSESLPQHLMRVLARVNIASKIKEEDYHQLIAGYIIPHLFHAKVLLTNNLQKSLGC